MAKRSRLAEEEQRKQREERRELAQLAPPWHQTLQDGLIDVKLFFNLQGLPVYVAKRTGRSHGHSPQEKNTRS